MSFCPVKADLTPVLHRGIVAGIHNACIKKGNPVWTGVLVNSIIGRSLLRARRSALLRLWTFGHFIGADVTEQDGAVGKVVFGQAVRRSRRLNRSCRLDGGRRHAADRALDLAIGCVSVGPIAGEPMIVRTVPVRVTRGMPAVKLPVVAKSPVVREPPRVGAAVVAEAGEMAEVAEVAAATETAVPPGRSRGRSQSGRAASDGP